MSASALPESIVAELSPFREMVEATCGLPLLVPIDLPGAYTWSWQPLGPIDTDIYIYNADVQSTSAPDLYAMTFDVSLGSSPTPDPESMGYSLEPNLDPVGGSRIYRISSEGDAAFWFEIGNVGETGNVGVTLWLGRGCEEPNRETIGDHICISWAELNQLFAGFSVVE